MANIQTYLEQIKNAIYGKDVRQAIHDAIHQCYQDGRAGKEDLIAREQIQSLSNPNLLINSDFRNPVNQRGATSYTSTNSWDETYTIDRWCMMSGLNKMSLTVNDGSITVATGDEVGHFRQQFEHKLPNGDYTITINVLSMNGSASFHTDNGNKLTIQEGKNVFTVTDTVTYVNILMDANSTIKIEYIKLEQGSLATPFVPRFFGEELALCQRYYTRLSTTYPMLVTQRSSADTKTYIFIPTPQSLRDAPTVEFANVKLLQDGVGGSWWDVNNVTCIGYSNMGVTLQLDCDASLQANTSYYLILPNSGYIKLDAEIK